MIRSMGPSTMGAPTGTAPASARWTLREGTPSWSPLMDADLRSIELDLASVCTTSSSRIEQAARHGLFGGGKRARPRLTCVILRAFGHDPGPVIDMVSAVELAHAGSLLHDDVIDGSGTRRGRASGHVAFDVPTAILAGDLLLTLAMERVACRGPRQLQVALSRAVRDLSVGASLERERLFDASVDRAHTRRVNRLKTASLFAYAAEAGAILAGAETRHCRAASSYGMSLGEAFQTTDDLLDLCGDPGKLGKPIGQDLVAGEVTVPVAMAVERAPELREDLRVVWSRAAAGADPSVPLAALRDRMECVGALTAAREMARQDSARARAALAELPSGVWRDRLEDMAVAVVRRQR